MAQVLNLPAMGIRDDFFAHGGHSLLAARLATLLSRETQVTVPLRTLFESPTAETLANAIDRIGNEATADARMPVRRRAARAFAPLTPMQERICFLEKLHPGSTAYNLSHVYRLGGALDIGLLRAALQEIARRQPALRTSIGTDPATGAPVQVIAPELTIDLPLVDLRAIPADRREAELLERLQAVADAPIDIHRPSLFHATLYRVAEDDHALIFATHHLVWDRWSFGVMQTELSTIYAAMQRGESHGLPELAVDHGDHAAWYGEWLRQPGYAKQLAFWKTRFAEADVARPLPTDRPRNAGMSGHGAALHFEVDAARTDRLRALARTHDVTLSMLTMGLYLAMLGRVVDGEAIVVAAPVHGRDAPELEPVIGFFNNVLPMPFRVDRQLRLGEFLRYVKQEWLAVMPYQQVPFERLVQEPEFAARARGAGLYQALFSFHHEHEQAAPIGGLRQTSIELQQRSATDDLGLWLADTPRGLEGMMIYNADIYRRDTAMAFRDRYLELLQAAVEQPDATLESITMAAGSTSAALLDRLAGAEVVDPTGVEATTAPTPMPQLLLPEQARLAQIWASALNIDVNEVRASDNFFDLGGDSLLAMRLIQQAEQELGFRIEPRRYLFESLGQLASAEAGTKIEPAEALLYDAAPQRRGLLGRVLGWGRRN
ncbi:MAG: condensation domain-containing protein, partial [Variovorax sp.]